jgi:hypothetical protein
MKKIPLLLLAVCFFFTHLTANAQQAPTKKTAHKVSKGQSLTSSIIGAWQSVDNNEFEIVNEGFF